MFKKMQERTTILILVTLGVGVLVYKYYMPPKIQSNFFRESQAAGLRTGTY